MATSLTRKGAALFALFSILPAMAQEVITKGNQRQPHQPPEWFSRMANPSAVYVPDEIRQPLPEVHLHLGKLFAEDGRVYCWKMREGREVVGKCEN